MRRKAAPDTLGIELQAKVSDYLDFVMTLIFAFGLTFQMPVLLALLGRVGIVSAAMLRKVRRYAIVGIFALAAVMTPPDLFSMISLAVPLVLLYEVSIWCVGADRAKRRAKEDAAREAEDRRRNRQTRRKTPIRRKSRKSDAILPLSIFFGRRSCGRITI